MNYASWLIDQLIRQGIKCFCIAPGSRSTPLALAAARHRDAQLTVHFDERGLGFYAVGLALASKMPVALIVTSGTAVGNLMPAVMEAFHSRVPLLLLTADRPAELRDCGANQTTDQIKFFQQYVLWQTELPCEAPESFTRAQASYAFFQALRKGPVHINCPFREPLYAQPIPFASGTPQPLFFPELTCKLDDDVHQFFQTRRGLILIGRMPFGISLSPIFHLAKRLGWPIFADLLSSARTHPAPDELITHFDYLLADAPLPEQIIHFGGRFTSKNLLSWMKTHQIPVLQVSSDSERQEPLHAARVWADPNHFCSAISLKAQKSPVWLPLWKELDLQKKAHLEACFSEKHSFTEPDLMRAIGKQLPEDWALFIANSMPIRDAEHFLFPQKASGFFANRGLSGIDGQIATAVGIAESLSKPLCAIIGDQSCLHDLNSLSLLHRLKTPFQLIISNNFGGGIFSHLSVAHDHHFELLFGNQHQYHFEKAAEMFQIPYRRVEETESLGQIFFPTSSILEVCTSRQENKRFRDLLSKNPCSTPVF